MSITYTDLMVIIRQKRTKETFSDSQILLALQETEQAIKNYCHIVSVPDALKFVWCDMTLDLLLYNYESNLVSDSLLDSIDIDDVASLKIGDTSIALGGSYRNSAKSKIKQSHTSDVDSITMNYKVHLNQFRRIW